MSESIHLVDPVTGAPLLAQATLENAYLVVAHQIFPVDFERADAQHSLALKEPYVLGCQSYAIGIHQFTGATSGQVHDIVVRGNPKTSSALKST